MNIIITPDYETMSQVAANKIALQMLLTPNLRLGLATGTTPVGTYGLLVQYFKAGIIDFQKVMTANLDEYIGLPPGHHQQYDWFMNHHLFEHVNCTDWHLPNGNADDLNAECIRYDEIAKDLDIQILGIGTNGHIGFNEPSDQWTQGTCIADLTEQTILDNAAKYFDGDTTLVPKTALSMGIAQILRAKRIILLADGIKKAQAIYDMIHCPITPWCPASALQDHPDVTVIIDREAAKLHLLP